MNNKSTNELILNSIKLSIYNPVKSNKKYRFNEVREINMLFN